MLLKHKEQNLKFLKDVGILHTTYHEIPLLINPDDITMYGADQMYVLEPRRNYVTIEKFIFIKYGISLKYPMLPCIVMFGDNGRHILYPIELLYVFTTQYPTTSQLYKYANLSNCFELDGLSLK